MAKQDAPLTKMTQEKNEKAFYLNLGSYLADTSMKIKHEV